MKNNAFVFSLMILCASLQAQPVNNYLKNVIMPSPAAASLGKYTDIPVSYYTGVPNIGIPIYTVTEGPLSLPVSLSYHASGVKVGEAPSWVGQNWTLAAGGMISRTVQGFKDEEATKGWLKSAAIPDPPIYDYNGDLVDGDFCGFTEHYIVGDKDSEPDIFSFNFTGYGGKFYFKKDGSVVLVPQQDIKIIPQFSASASDLIHLKGFSIITPDGAKYLFGDTGDGSPAIETNIGGGGDLPEIVTGWYLKKIETADSKFSISLSYAGDYSRTDFQPGRIVSCGNPGPGGDGLSNLSSNYTFVKGQRITSIVTSTANLTFTPGAAREDLEIYPVSPYNTDPPKVLASISIASGIFQKKFDFTYDYWIDNSTDQVAAPNTKLNKRLRLLNVQEKSGDGTIVNPSWTFEYFSKSGSPNFMPHRISRSVDHWGFYNEKNNGAYTSTQPNIPSNQQGTCLHGGDCNYWGKSGGSYDRSINEAAMKYGSLKKITYPTGGYTEFDLEANDYYTTDPVYDTLNLIHIDGAYSIGGYSCSTSTFYSNPPQIYSFSQSALNTSRYEWKLKPNTNNCSCVEGATSMRIKVYNASSGALYTQSALINISCSPANGTTGNGNLSSFFPIALQADVSYKFEMVVIQGGADFKIRQPIVNYSNNVKVGGLRVKQVKTHDGISSANDIIRTYEYKDSVNTTRSSGVLYGKPYYVHSYSWFPCRNPKECGSRCAPACPQYQLPTGGCNVNFYENSIVPISSFEGYHIGYQYVKEIHNGNGSRTFTYYTEGGNAAQYPTPPAPARILAGNLKYATTRNAAGVILATESHTPFNDAYTESTDVMYKKVENQCGRFVTVYKIRTRPYREASMTNVLDGIGTTTTYTYDSQNNHLQKVTEEVTNSDGTAYRTKYKYALDYPCPTGTNCDETNGVNTEAKAIYAMRKRYMIAIPIEQTTWLKRPGWGSHRLTSATYFQFDKVNASYNNLKLKTVQQVRPATPLTTFTESGIASGSFSKSSSYAVEYNFAFSDAHGNLLSQWKQNDPAKEQYIWGHKQKLPVAKVVNAEANEIAYASFEEPGIYDGTATGNWVITPNNIAGWSNTSNNFYTGRTGFHLTPARTCSIAGLPAGKYIVSFWHRDGRVTVNGATVSTATSTTWKYAETELTFTAGSNTVSVTGLDWNQYVDELRLYPADALMQTFSFHDSTLLLLSTADENSVPAYYEYDALQRLQALRDQDRNIVQTYEYNYHLAGSVINNIKSRSVLISGQTTLAQVNALTGANVRRVFQYMDGLGRPIQASAVGQSPTSLDIVTYQQYDSQNREPKRYIPYTATSNSGAYRTDAATAQATFASTWGSAGYGYAETVFETSPLNRVKEQASPGTNWRMGMGHTVEMAYRANTSAEAVRDFTNNNSFSDNKLFVNEETDENERKRYTYTDKLGRVVMVKQQIAVTPTVEDDHWARTYTIYDDFGRVAAVIPPEAARKMKTSGSWDWTLSTYASMVYKYAYDSRGRMTSKTVPSGGTTTVAYDRLDRPVLTTDANGFKIFTRYDILSRPVVSGRYKGTASPGVTDPLYETPNTTAPHYYTSTAFPTDNNLDVYKVLYYDDYDIDNNGSLGSTETYTNPAESGYETAAFLRTRGKPTSAKTAILKNDNSAPTTYLTARTYYDKEYSVIQINKQNHLSGSDIISNAYDFANRLTKTRRDHTATPPGGTLKTYTIREEYVYDHASRLRFTRHKINVNNWVVTSAPLYDELDRLADKRLHASNYDGVSSVTLSSNFNYLQSLDYTYNIRGWLTGINDPTSCSTQNGDNLVDLFRMQLTYESNANGGTEQYNGNIATMQWNTHINGVCGTRQLYQFSYDGANRLTAAAHRTWSGSAWTDPNRYNESGITYDLNGNILTYTRRGLTASPSTFGTIDQLAYTYGDAARPDRLTKVIESGDYVKGFKYLPNLLGNHYFYDNNGNLTQDRHKNLNFDYNYLNLPDSIFITGSSYISITYTADGEKLRKISPTETRNYVAGIEYLSANLDAIYHAEGRCTPNGATAFHYEYTLKDHLGNARVNFRANGTAVTFLEEMHYYPFGMLMEGIGTAAVTVNKYKYNGKELNDDLGLNLSDYGARWYDAALGRWWSVDPLGEGTASHSVYHYAFNNPMAFVDPNGMSAVGADGLTNEQWVESSRQGNNSKSEEYKKENISKEIEGMRREKSTALNTYVTNTLSVSELSAAQLVQALNYVADIYSKNGLSEVFYFKILSESEAKSLSLGKHDLFIGIKESKALVPGFSEMTARGDLTTYLSNGELATYANWHWAKEYSKSNPVFALGYLMAHEFLHQLNQKATYNLEGGDAALLLRAHDNSIPNLNMEGPVLVNTWKQFPKSPSPKLRQAETILDHQRSKIIRYLFEVYLNK